MKGHILSVYFSKQIEEKLKINLERYGKIKEFIVKFGKSQTFIGKLTLCSIKESMHMINTKEIIIINTKYQNTNPKLKLDTSLNLDFSNLKLS
jgi:hypothetical protein